MVRGRDGSVWATVACVWSRRQEVLWSKSGRGSKVQQLYQSQAYVVAHLTQPCLKLIYILTIVVNIRYHLLVQERHCTQRDFFLLEDERLIVYGVHCVCIVYGLNCVLPTSVCNLCLKHLQSLPYHGFILLCFFGLLCSAVVKSPKSDARLWA